jgi:hypothetical protein
MRNSFLLHPLHRGLAIIPVLALMAIAPSAQSARQTGATKYTAPLTPWGDPDLQGVWSFNDDVSTPFERPNDLGVKDELEDEELAALLKERERRNIERAPTIGGETGAGPVHWYEFWNSTSTRPSRVIDPPDGRVPALTPAAQARQAALAAARRGRGPADSWLDRNLSDRCLGRGVPGTIVTPASYGNILRITQAPGYVAIVHEMVHDTRIIPLDGRPHLGQGLQQFMGDPRGRWEGDTLVVEVTNFTDKVDFRGSRETLRLVERYRRVAGNQVSYEVTVNDPVTFTRPWTVAVPLKSDPSQPDVFEYACHEGNYAMRNILSAARAEERAAAEKR